MNAKQQIEQHIQRQAETLDSWTKASPEIRERIISQGNRIAALETARSKDSALIADLLQRVEALEAKPTGLFSLLK